MPHQSFLDVTRHYLDVNLVRNIQPPGDVQSPICFRIALKMALLSQDPLIPGTASASPDTALAELTQLLLRLQNNLLHPTPDREKRLRTSEYERAKAEAVRQAESVDMVR